MNDLNVASIFYHAGVQHNRSADVILAPGFMDMAGDAEARLFFLYKCSYSPAAYMIAV
jgi:hypothetical protein